MEIALSILVAVVPPSVVALASPKSEAWRRARERYWIATATMFGVGLGTLALIELVGANAFFLGPAAGWFFALFVNALAMSAWLYFTNELYDQRREWRAAQHVPTQRDFSKPWNF